MNESSLDTDVLTLAVLLPESENERHAFLEHIAKDGELHGTMPIGVMTGNLINYVRIHDAIMSNEPAQQIYDRLHKETAYRLEKALVSRADEAKSHTKPAQPGHAPAETAAAHVSAAGYLKFGGTMFLLGALVSYHFF